MSTALIEPSAASFGSRSSVGSLRTDGNRFRSLWRHQRAGRAVGTMAIYRVTDRLHEGRAVDVPGHEIVTTVSAWLAELDAHSPLVEDLAQAVRAGDWPAAYAIGDRLSVDVTVAA
jgi:hypothetical protein